MTIPESHGFSEPEPQELFEAVAELDEPEQMSILLHMADANILPAAVGDAPPEDPAKLTMAVRAGLLLLDAYGAAPSDLSDHPGQPWYRPAPFEPPEWQQGTTNVVACALDVAREDFESLKLSSKQIRYLLGAMTVEYADDDRPAVVLPSDTEPQPPLPETLPAREHTVVEENTDQLTRHVRQELELLPLTPPGEVPDLSPATKMARDFADFDMSRTLRPHLVSVLNERQLTALVKAEAARAGTNGSREIIEMGFRRAAHGRHRLQFNQAASRPLEGDYTDTMPAGGVGQVLVSDVTGIRLGYLDRIGLEVGQAQQVLDRAVDIYARRTMVDHVKSQHCYDSAAMSKLLATAMDGDSQDFLELSDKDHNMLRVLNTAVATPNRRRVINGELVRALRDDQLQALVHLQADTPAE